MAKCIITIPVGVSIEVQGGGNSLTTVVLKAGIKGDKGDPGDSGFVGYTHNQIQALSTWTINHNLGKRPSIVLLSVGGVEFNGTIIHTSINQAIVYLEIATAGTAQCN